VELQVLLTNQDQVPHGDGRFIPLFPPRSISLKRRKVPGACSLLLASSLQYVSARSAGGVLQRSPSKIPGPGRKPFAVLAGPLQNSAPSFGEPPRFSEGNAISEAFPRGFSLLSKAEKFNHLGPSSIVNSGSPWAVPRLSGLTGQAHDLLGSLHS